MDLVSAAMSLYLLFPVISDGQQRYSQWIKKNISSSPAIVEKRLELIKFLGLNESDVDQELLLADESVPDDSADGKKTEKSIAEKYYTDINDFLKIYEYDDEKFNVSENQKGVFSVASVNGDSTTRIKFDSQYRISEQIEWKYAATIEGSLMSSKKVWNYSEYGISMTEENFVEKTYSTTLFNSSKLPEKITLYNIVEVEVEDESSKNVAEKDESAKDDKGKKELEKEEVKKEEKKILSKISYYFYDDEKRILSEKEEFYEEKKNQTTGRVRNSIVYSTEKKFIYTGRSETPDLKYYEDDQLRVEIKYIDNDSYFESVHFEGGGVIRSKYEDGNKVEEEFFLERSR